MAVACGAWCSLSDRAAEVILCTKVKMLLWQLCYQACFVVQGEEQGAMSISLPRVSSAELLLFPETAEGHVSKVIKTVRLPALPWH